MTVAELIRELKHVDQNADVVWGQQGYPIFYVIEDLGRNRVRLTQALPPARGGPTRNYYEWVD